jgi:hypothetical protein
MSLTPAQRQLKRKRDAEYSARRRRANKVLKLAMHPQFRLDMNQTGDKYADMKAYFKKYGHQPTINRLDLIYNDTLEYRKGNVYPGRYNYYFNRPLDDDDVISMWWYH